MPSRTQHGHALVSLVLCSALVATPAVASEIFKCLAKDGSPLYQNFPCDIDSLGSLPSKPNVTQPTPSAISRAVNATSTGRSTSPGELRVGMTIDEVKSLLGEPAEIVEDEPRSGRVSIWRYADGRIVQFDNKHRVFRLQP